MSTIAVHYEEKEHAGMADALHCIAIRSVCPKCNRKGAAGMTIFGASSYTYDERGSMAAGQMAELIDKHNCSAPTDAELGVDYSFAIFTKKIVV